MWRTGWRRWARVRGRRVTVGALWAELEQAGGNGSGRDLEWLLASHLGCARLELTVRRAQEVGPRLAARIRAGAGRLAAGEPLAYVLGTAAFRDLELRVDRRVLIPRPETEQLVDLVLADAARWARPGGRLVEVGTGSGCIALALAVARPAADIWAVDCSRRALALARRNAAAYPGARLTFQANDLLRGFPAGHWDAVVANLPYISSAEYAALPFSVRGYEPRRALESGPTGLELIARCVRQAARQLRPAGGLYLEIGADQGAAVTALLNHAGFERVRCLRDWADRDRFVLGVQTAVGPLGQENVTHA
ncbi:MAG: peptide chain release factor N(5)-glutamine methyltransferase [Candidatus Marinimicrobia bacterium]|nr:peptide chain release factor N(5)-glutamine methyltransferase [Candidatus Neomarinimicrobiota bacterium]